MFDLWKFWKNIKDQWHNPILPIIVALMWFIFFLSKHDISNLKILVDDTINWLLVVDFSIYLSSIILFTIIWWRTSRLPQNPSDKVGIIIAISTENENEKVKLKTDFIDQVNKVIRAENKNSDFNIIEYPEFFSKKLNNSNAFKYLITSRAHYMIYGSFKKRNIQGVPSFVFLLEAVVVHSPLPEAAQKPFAVEFASVFPKELAVDEKIELEGLGFASKWVGLVTKYMLAKAAFVSRDIHWSNKIFRELYAENKQIKTDIPAILKIKSRIPFWISRTSELIANSLYDKYAQTNKIAYLNEAKQYCDIIKVFEPNNYKSNLLLSIYYFVVMHRVDLALVSIDKCKTNADCTWLYNKAFLLAYRDQQGDLAAAEKLYKKAFRINITDTSIIPKVEVFINELLEQEPNKYQLYYCLGLINYIMKNDNLLAKEYLKLFIDSDQGKYPDQVRKATEYLHHLSITTPPPHPIPPAPAT